MQNPENKICCKCGVKKPLIEFPKCKKSSGGFRKECKKCRSSYAVDWKNNNRDKWLIARRKTRKKNQMKNNCRKRDLHKRNKENLTDSYLKRLLRRKYGIMASQANAVVLQVEKKYCEIKKNIKINFYEQSM